jgi:hypothetical protein
LESSSVRNDCAAIDLNTIPTNGSKVCDVAGPPLKDCE